MPLTKRPRGVRALTVLIAVVALGGAGCGVTSNDDASPRTDPVTVDTTEPGSKSDATTTTEGGSTATTDEPGEQETTTTEDDSTTTTSEDGTVPPSEPSDVRDKLISLYTGMGLSNDQASCLADAIIRAGATSTSMQQDDMFALIEECDISAEDLANIGSQFGQ